MQKPRIRAVCLAAIAAALVTAGVWPAGAGTKDNGGKNAGKVIVWQPSLAAAEKEAKRTGKPVLIVFQATWCGACRMLEREVLPRREVTEEAQKWVTVKVDVDKEQEIAGQYGIRNLPTTVFYRADGGRKFGFTGAPQAGEMVKIMKVAYTKVEQDKAKKK